MKSKVTKLCIMLGLILGSTSSINAQDVNVTGDTLSASTPSNLSVSATDLAEGELVVTIPNSLTLSYSSTDGESFTVSDVVTAKGNINPSKQLEISVPETVDYVHSDATNIHLTGNVDFGVSNKEVWSVDELKASFTTEDSRDITVSVPFESIEYIGVYASSVEFNINLVNAEQN